MLVQQNLDGSNFFHRSWGQFRVGFGQLIGNYWIGNDRLHQLTTSGSYTLRFDLQETGTGTWYYAEYSTFIVQNETSNYLLQASGYSGNAGDALYYNDGMMFTTYDRDNDQRSDNCAVSRGGGFWYKNCAYCGVNVERGSPDDFKWRGNGATAIVLESTRMWLTC